MEKEIFGKIYRGTENQLKEIYDLLNHGCYHDKKFKHYFIVFGIGNSGVFYFPHEKYFVEKDGERNYAVALANYVGQAEAYSL